MRLHHLFTGLAFTVAIACGGSEGEPPVATDPAPALPPSGNGPDQGNPVPPSSSTGGTGGTGGTGNVDPAPTSMTPPVVAPVTATSCFANLKGAITGPDYDKTKPKIAQSCAGTHHQTIAGVEKVVFLGDSVTTGTPPTLPNEIYRDRVYQGVKTRFGNNVAVADCSAWGADTEDFLTNKNQLTTCFPAPEPKRTLVVMTMGGNDIASWAKKKLSTPDAMAAADAAGDRLRAAVDWLQTPGRFPNGVFVVFANVYEYTDTSGDLASCPTATVAGLAGAWPAGAPAIVHFQERFMEVATATKTDMIFLLEHFCGHGYKRNDASLQCYRGPGSELWFDLTCIHPTPKGHEQIANLFLKVIDGI